jgi:hypothetical protein
VGFVLDETLGMPSGTALSKRMREEAGGGSSRCEPSRRVVAGHPPRVGRLPSRPLLCLCHLCPLYPARLQGVCNQRSGSTSGFDRRACPRAGLTYSGKIRFIQRNLLLQAIARTHGGRLPETGPVFVEVRVALPTGLALAEHSKSKVQFSLPNSDPPRFTLKIANWPNGVPEFWRQPAFMDFIR